MQYWRPDIFAKKIPYLKKRAEVFSNIRDFFNKRNYLEVETQALQVSPCMEPHIQAFKTEYLDEEKYLHTSPEFAMKKLLVAGLPKIYQLAKVFRKEPKSSMHSPEFTMLEWYQAGMGYKDLMQETMDLIRHVAKEKISFKGLECDVHQEWEVISFVEAFKKYAGVDVEKYCHSDRAERVEESLRSLDYARDDK